MRSVNGVTIDTAKLDKITAEMQPKASKIVRAYGLMATSSAIKNAPVDTGNLINTISANSKLIEPLLYRVQDGTEYGVFQEFGTSRIAARPFLFPAIEGIRQKFLNAFSELFK